MNKNSEEIMKLKKTLRLDAVIDYYDAGKFKEITGRQGGDVVTFRVYRDGTIFEK